MGCLPVKSSTHDQTEMTYLFPEFFLVFNSTLCDLSPELLIDSIRARKRNFLCFRAIPHSNGFRLSRAKNVQHHIFVTVSSKLSHFVPECTFRSQVGPDGSAWPEDVVVVVCNPPLPANRLVNTLESSDKDWILVLSCTTILPNHLTGFPWSKLVMELI